MARWHKFVGLPFQLHADPWDGIGADCLLTVFAVQDLLGIEHPEPEQRWYELEAQRDISAIFDLFYGGVVEVKEQPQEGDFTVIPQTEPHFGMAVLIDKGALCVTRRRGVVWLPPAMLKTWLVWYRWRS